MGKPVHLGHIHNVAARAAAQSAEGGNGRGVYIAYLKADDALRGIETGCLDWLLSNWGLCGSFFNWRPAVEDRLFLLLDGGKSLFRFF